MAALSTSSVKPRHLDPSLEGKLVLPGDGALRRGPAGLEPRRRPAACRRGRSRSRRPTWPPPSVARPSAGCGSPPRAPATTPGRSARWRTRCCCRTERMRGIRIDPQARVARVRGGRGLARRGARRGPARARRAGRAPRPMSAWPATPSAAGMSFLGRKYGLAANNVLAIEMVTADGRAACVPTTSTSPTCSGRCAAAAAASGSSPRSSSGSSRSPMPTRASSGTRSSAASEVLHAWGELTRGGPPDELTTVGRFLNLPPIPQIPEPVRGKSFVIVEAYHLGDPAQADELLAPLRALGPVNDTIATVPDAGAQPPAHGPRAAGPGAGDGLMLDRAARPRRSTPSPRPPAPGAAFPLLSVELRHLGGEFGRPRPGNGALASIDAQYALYAVGMTPVPELVAPVTAQVEAVKHALAPVGGGADVPQLRRDTATRGAVLDRAGLPAAAPDQGGHRPRRHDPFQPPGPAGPVRPAGSGGGGPGCQPPRVLRRPAQTRRARQGTWRPR